MLIGSHVSMSGKKMLQGSAEEAHKYGESTFMIYTGAPQNTRRKNIEDLNIKIDNRNVIKVTASIGVKRFDINNRTLEENIALADKSLYKAKTLGKNKVVY